MNQEVHIHLEKLKSELSKLEPAVKHLQKADENATALVSALSNIHKEFAKHLEKIEKSLNDSNEKHQKLLTKEVQDASNKLKDVGNSIGSAFSKSEKNVKNLLEEYSFLSSETVKLVEKIDGIEFPKRLDKIDVTISSIVLGLQKNDLNQTKLDSGVQTTQQKVNDLSSNVKADIDFLRSLILAKIELLDELFYKNITAVQKQLIYQKILFISIAVLNVIIMALLLIKK